MALRKTFSAVCLVVSMLCLAGWFGFAGQWIGAAIAIATGLAWLPARKYPLSPLPHICLIASVTLAVAGILTGTPPFLMICGSGLALAIWDLILLDGTLGTNSSGEQTGRYENKHLQSLALALGAGLLAAFLGEVLHLRVPFVAMMLFVAMVLFGFDRIWRTISNRSPR